jgi:hypothetical protein
MKKVLIINYNFLDDFIGSVRMRGLAKYLPLYNWEPIILTNKVNCSNLNRPICNIVETEYDDLICEWKKIFKLDAKASVTEQLGIQVKQEKNTLVETLISLWDQIFAYPDINKGWIRYAVKEGDAILSNKQFDAIISSSPPATAHIIGRQISLNNHVPWIADLRDPWVPYNIKHGSIRKYFDRRLQYRTLKDAACLVTISEPLSNQLKWISNNVRVITNGFENAVSYPSARNDKLRIVYTGYIYKNKQDPEPLFQAIHELVNECLININDIQVDLYGKNIEIVKDEVLKYNLENIVNFNGFISREESLKIQRAAQILLLLTWNDKNERGVYTGKLFDYLAARRPILAVGNYKDEAAMLVEKVDVGRQASSVEDIKKELIKYYNEYKANGTIAYKCNDNTLGKYSLKEMARKYAEILNMIL